MTEPELRPCPLCGHQLVRSGKRPYPDSFEHPLVPCIRQGNLFCPADEKEWNSAYCWKEIEELRRERDANKQQSNSWAEVATQHVNDSVELRKELEQFKIQALDAFEKQGKKLDAAREEIQRLRNGKRTVKCQCGESTIIIEENPNHFVKCIVHGDVEALSPAKHGMYFPEGKE